MAVLAIAAVGAMAGTAAFGTGIVALGMTGAQIGWMAGSMLGNALMNRQHTKGPQLEDKRVVGVDYGAALPWVAGAPRIAGTLAWGSDFREIANTEEVGKGGGSSYTSYTYEMDALFIVADQPGATVTRVFSAGKLVWTGLASADDDSRIASEGTTLWRRMTVYQGGESQFPDPVYEAAVANAPAYRGRTCVFFEGLQLGNSGVLPNFTFEVASDASDSTTMVRRTAIADVLGSGTDQAALEAGLPLIRRMTPTVAVERPGSAHKFGFTLAGVDVGWPAGFTPFAIPAQNISDTGIVGLIDGQIVRRQHSSAYQTGTGRVLLSIGATDGATNDGLPDLAAPLPGGRYVVGAIMCSDGVHACILANTSTVGGQASEFYIVKRMGGATSLVSSGPVASGAILTVFGSGGTYHGAAGMLEENLRHLWTCRGFGAGEVVLSYINDEGEMVPGSLLQSGAGLLQYSFTYPTCWAEAGFFVVVNKGDFHTFRREGSTINDVTLRSTVEALCQRATMPAGTYDASALASITRPVRALAVESGSVRQALEVLMASHAFDAYVTDKLYFRPRGGAVVATIPREDLAAGEGDAAEEPFALQVGADLEIPNRVAVTYRNMQADQQPATEHSDRGPSGQDSLQSVQIAVGLLPTEAKGVADGLVLDGFASRLTSEISLPLGYSHLVPTDSISVPDEDGTLYRMRIVRRNEQGGVLGFELVGEDGQALAVPAPTAEGYVSKTSVVDTGETILHVLDIPLLRDTDDGPGVYVAARGTTAAWPGCSVMVSTNGASFTSVAEIGEAATLGAATTLLAAGPTDIMDTANTVTVNVGPGQLSSLTRAALFADPATNVMLLGAEVVRFQTATLVTASPNVYRLSGLLRGQRGTEWAVGTHAINERAVLLQARGLRRVSLALADIGRELAWKGVNRGQMVDAAPSQTVTVTGVSQRPYSPHSLRSSTSVTSEVSLSWQRRTRMTTTIADGLGIVHPLGEASEAYEVDVFDSSNTLLRTVRTTRPAAVISAAARGKAYQGRFSDITEWGGHIYARTDEGRLARIDATTGAVIAQSALASSWATIGAAGYLGGIGIFGVFYSGAGVAYLLLNQEYYAWAGTSSQKIVAIDMATLTAIASADLFVSGGTAGFSGVFMGGKIYIAGQTAAGTHARVTKMDAATLAVEASATIGAFTDGAISISDDGAGGLCLFGVDGSSFVRLDTSLSETARTVIGAGSGYWLVRAGGVLFAVGGYKFTAIDIATGAVIAQRDFDFVGPLLFVGGFVVVQRNEVSIVGQTYLPGARECQLIDPATGVKVGDIYPDGNYLAGSVGGVIVCHVGPDTVEFTPGASLAGGRAVVHQISAAVGRGYPTELGL